MRDQSKQPGPDVEPSDGQGMNATPFKEDFIKTTALLCFCYYKDLILRL